MSSKASYMPSILYAAIKAICMINVEHTHTKPSSMCKGSTCVVVHTFFAPYTTQAGAQMGFGMRGSAVSESRVLHEAPPKAGGKLDFKVHNFGIPVAPRPLLWICVAFWRAGASFVDLFFFFFLLTVLNLGLRRPLRASRHSPQSAKSWATGKQLLHLLKKEQIFLFFKSI